MDENRVIRADPCPCTKEKCKDKPCPNGIRPCDDYIMWDKRNYGR